MKDVDIHPLVPELRKLIDELIEDMAERREADAGVDLTFRDFSKKHTNRQFDSMLKSLVGYVEDMTQRHNWKERETISFSPYKVINITLKEED